MSNTGKRILLIESDRDTMLLLKTSLTEAGYFVECHMHGSELLERLRAKPDLFILDKELPEIDGIAIAKFLRIQEETKNIPILLMSSFPVKARAEKAGVNCFVEKPFDLNQFLANVAECLKSRKLQG